MTQDQNKNALDNECPLCGALPGQSCTLHLNPTDGEPPFLHLTRGRILSQPIEQQGLVLKGWTCTSCGVFNGAEKAWRTHCRSCERPSLTYLDPNAANQGVKKWKIMLRSYWVNGEASSKLYRGPFNSYEEARHERTKELASGKWDEGWVYEAEQKIKRPKKAAAR